MTIMPINSPPIIYLDQNAWIALAKVKWKKEEDPSLVAAYEKVLKATDMGKALFPLSIVNIFETLTRIEPESRKRLAKFMIDISKGSTICPYLTVTEVEMRNAVRKRAGISENSIIPIGQGIGHALGSKPEIVGEIDETLKKELINLVVSPETLLWLLSKQELAERLHTHGKENAAKIEEIRKKDFAEMPDPELRKRVCIARAMRDLISRPICKYCLDAQIPIEKIIPHGVTQTDLLDLFKDCKTAYTLHTLSYRRDQHRDKPVAENDLNDISALAMAIPYCDIVVTENFWTNIARHEKLDSIYKTVVLDSAVDLIQYL